MSERLANGPEWQLESNIKHHESAALDYRKRAQENLKQADEHDKLSQAFRKALCKVIKI